MFYRWLHKSWKYFWRVVLIILLVVTILVGGIMGLLQLDATQNYLANRIENKFEQSYKADLSIGEIDGFLPFRLRLQNVVLSSVDSLQTDTLATVEHIDSQIDVWGLLQNKISITGFSVNQPKIWVRTDENGTIQFLDRVNPSVVRSSDPEGELWLNRVEILAPAMQISGGAVYAEAFPGKKITGRFESFALNDINATFFIDWSERQRYLDIESFSANSKNLQMGNISFSGQVYSDHRFLEFNSFDITFGKSQLTLNGEVDGFNLVKPDLKQQFLTAHYDASVRSSGFYPREIRDILPAVPDVEGPFTFEFQTEGTTDSLWVDRASVGLGESIVSLNGLFQNLREKEDFNYRFTLDRVTLRRQDMEQLVATLKTPQYRALETLSVSGSANGTLQSANVKLGFTSPLGQLSVEGNSQLAEPYKYVGSISAQNLDISPLDTARFDTTSLNFDGRLDGFGLTLDKAVTEFTATFYQSRVNQVAFDRLELNSSLVSGLLQHEYRYQNGEEFISGSGWLDFDREEPRISMQGNAQNINLVNVFGSSAIASTDLNFDYNVELQGLTPDRIQGRANLDVKTSIVGGDTVRAHQLYMDLNSADAQTRTFRLTSSLFDMDLTGQLVPSDVFSQAKFWAAQLSGRFNKEILKKTSSDSTVISTHTPSKDVIFDGSITAKDLSLIRNYLPDFPDIQTDSRFKFSVNTDGIRLLLSAEMQADTLEYNQSSFKNGRLQLSASFRSDQSFKEFSTVDFQTSIGSMQSERLDLDSIDVDLSVKRDSIHYSQKVGSIAGRARFNTTLSSSLTDSAIVVSVRDFFMGNSQYAWTNRQTPSFTYKRNGNITFQNFNFQNQNEFFGLRGTLSSNRQDSLTYIIRDINLKRVSELITGKVDFSGILNGTLITRSLTRQPTIQGQLAVNRFELNNRMIGDISFNSRYNPQKDRFDTQIDLVTDSTKYEKYLETNDDIGQNIRLDGYFVTPNPEVEQDTVFYFDANFKQIDMWVLPLIISNVFAEMEGQASGEGYITGNLEDFDFHADFQTQNVYAKPRFLNTNYFLSGHVVFDRHNGVILDSVDVLDTTGGTGVVSGTVDLNDFKPITYLDLSMNLNNLQFLNSGYDPEVPFYGNIYGTGTVRLTGSNTDLYLRTEKPIRLTDDSDVSIPLLEETELRESGKFIRFVDSFDEVDQKTQRLSDEPAGIDENFDEDRLQEAIQSLTFSERFNLDLQFEASDNVTTHLIFDRAVGEILTSQGTGQLRITMQDQDLQMFGRYTINSGTYQFVVGEIVSRRLDLEPGGTITWEGPPDNARLDISAIYHARPNITTLTTEGNLNNREQSPGQQVPIDLVVEINGTINSVENNYYFQLPNSRDISTGSALSYTINEINRDEEQKLLQATSILFTGQFIPTQSTSATASLRQSLTRGSNVINPLISNQVISPLLSSQINALLNSDVSRLDVDLNLNDYGVDLGIALRLYNDRLILRREGLIGGESQNTFGEQIGDLNATYRIRRGLSLTVFHRQDQYLFGVTGTSQTGDVNPTVDGIGLETRVQFNTWKEFFTRIGDIFSKEKKDKEQDDEEKKGIAKKQKAISEEDG